MVFTGKEHVAPALSRTLSDLGVDYLDLYLIHFPISLKYACTELCVPTFVTNNNRFAYFYSQIRPIREAVSTGVFVAYFLVSFWPLLTVWAGVHDPSDPELNSLVMDNEAPLHETWCALEDEVAAGRVRAIGVCN